MTQLNNQSVIFHNSSIDHFKERLKLFIQSDTVLKNSIYYYGSFFYDVNGHYYQEKDLNEWVYVNGAGALLKNKYEEFPKDYLYITQILQRKYLVFKSYDFALHMYINDKNESCCEITPDVKYDSGNIYIYKNEIPEVINSDDGLIADKVQESFNWHFDWIRDSKSHLYFFPVILKLGNKEWAISVTTIVSKDRLNGENFNMIQRFLPSASLRLITDTSDYFYCVAENEAQKSAKAAIMSRNMSHNLGSHVMAYLKNDLRTISSIFCSRVLENLFPDQYQGNMSDIERVKDNVELPFLVGLGAFIGYLQERQDYIATIASSYIPSFSPVNFKDAIYDELNPDLKYERHKRIDQKNHNKPQNILLSYIVKSEKISRLATGGRDTHNIVLSFKGHGMPKFSGTGKEINSPSLAAMRKINFALPGGVVGRQAIFSIVENIIRNAAKHNNIDGNLELVFEVIDGKDLQINPDDYCESISNDKLRSQYCSSTDIKDLVILSITDNLPCDDHTVYKLSDALKQPYVGLEGQTNKGIKEIRISATWLRGVDDDTLFEEKGMAPAVAIEKATRGNQALRYLICLRKTYEFAIVYSTNDSIDKLRCCFSLKEGSYIFISAEEIKTSDTCFEYIIAESREVYLDIRPYVSNRCVEFSRIGKTLDIQDVDIYRAYTHIDLESSAPVYILDDKVVDVEFQDKIHKLIMGKSLSIPSMLDNSVISRETIAYALKLCDLVDENNVPRNTYAAILASGAIYMYRSHHFGDNDFSSYWKDRAFTENRIQSTISLYELKQRELENKQIYDSTLDRDLRILRSLNKIAPKSIDAITGDNSSDRLVRREPLNKKWYYHHLYALDSTVAIFDERLFQIIHGLDESRMTCGSFVASKCLDECVNKNWPEASTRLNDLEIDRLLNEMRILALPIRHQFKELYTRVVDSKGDPTIKKDLTDFLRNYVFRFQENIISDNYLTAAYHEKRVNVYTIIPTGDNSCSIVGNIGYQYTTVFDSVSQDLKPVYSFAFAPVVDIRWDCNTEDFICDVLSPIDKCQYISLHQGLIDKMYEAFHIKDAVSIEEEDRILLKKQKLLRSIYRCFMEKAEASDNSRLERLVVHSGRGNITLTDMPERLPFIQYSAIEHAVLDCKFALIELLDCAKTK